MRQDGDASDDESVTAMVSDDQLRDGFEAERPRLHRIAARILGDADAAQDVVQQAWLRLHATDEPIDNLAGWLTTVTSRLCLDRLRVRTPEPTESIEVEATAHDPADDVVLADTVGIALQVVLDRLTPAERVAFVLHDSFGVDFECDRLDARHDAGRGTQAGLSGARQGAPGRIRGLPSPTGRSWTPSWPPPAKATSHGCWSCWLPTWWSPPTRPRARSARRRTCEGPDEVASFFNGAAAAAFPVFVEDRPGAAWIHRGEVKVAFDFTVEAGRVRRLRFRADGRRARPASDAATAGARGSDHPTGSYAVGHRGLSGVATAAGRTVASRRCRSGSARRSARRKCSAPIEPAACRIPALPVAR